MSAILSADFARLVKSTSLRLAVIQTSLFVLTFALAGSSAFFVIRQAEHRAAHAEVEEYDSDVLDLLTHRGLPALVARMSGRHKVSGLDYRIEDVAGHLLAGGLPRPPTAPTERKYWSNFEASSAASPKSRPSRYLTYTRTTPAGLVVTVGEHLDVREREDNTLILTVALLTGLVATVGVAGGVVVGQTVLHRVDLMARAVDRYAAGDRSARLAAPKRRPSDLDDLATALNAMMDRENRLIEGLRQASSAIAHDLRRPLAHHNQEITLALAGPATIDDYRSALLKASARVDDVLQTFQSLLHIAELEAGAPGLLLEMVQLDAVASKVVEAYMPLAEAGGRYLSFSALGGATGVKADPRVLGQTIANLVENALTHTPEGTTVTVVTERATHRLMVTDNGRGVPEADQRRIFDRFFRLDASRSTPGSGLGLCLAAAATHAFGGRIWAADANPGLRIVAEFRPFHEV